MPDDYFMFVPTKWKMPPAVHLIIVLMLAVLLVVVVSQLLFTERERINGTQQIIRVESYTRGYMDAVRSCLVHFPLSTNAVELEPVLRDMRPEGVTQPDNE